MFSTHSLKEHFILQFVTNIQHQHIWRYVVFTGQEGEEKLSSEKQLMLKLSDKCNVSGGKTTTLPSEM